MGRVTEKVLLSLVIIHGVLMVEKAVERVTVSRKDMIMHQKVQKDSFLQQDGPCASFAPGVFPESVFKI